MKRKFYFQKKLKAICFAFMGLAATAAVTAQEYADTTGLVADIEAGLYEEYILAPASVEDTFFIDKQIEMVGSAIIKAKDGLGFKPVVTGSDEEPNYLFLFPEEIIGGADFELQGLHFVGFVGDKNYIDDGTIRVETEDINITIKDCEFYDFKGYNTIAKIYNSGGDITIDNVLTYNTAGKIIQVNYKDNNSTVNYVPKIGDLTITNSTFVENYKRIFFELGAGDVPIDPDDENIKQRFNAGAENVTIDHCTFFRHIGVNLMQGRSYYEFAGDMAAIEGAFTLTNTIFAAMDENMNADSASQWIFDGNYYGFGAALPEEEIDDVDALYSPTNTVATSPVFADTASGAWDLTLQNEADILGVDGTPIGDPRWWTQEWTRTSVENKTEVNAIAKVFAYSNRLIIEAEEFSSGQASIFNITGRLVHATKLRSDRTEIELPLGLYIVKVNTNKGNQAAKVLIGQ
jgi:hypothetical protein